MPLLPLHNYARISDPEVRHIVKPKNQETLVVTTLDSIEVIRLNQIMYLKSDSNYTRIRMVDKSELVISKTLKSFDFRLRSTFLRVHHSYLINPSFIKSYFFKSNSLVLDHEIEIPVSRRRKNEVIAYLKNLEN